MILPRTYAAVLVLSLFIALCPSRVHAAVSPDWARRWRDDLRFAADTLPRVHANLFHTLSRNDFARAMDSLAAEVPTLDHDDIAVGLARILARVGDGHTRLTFPFDSAAGFFTGHSTTADPLVPDLVFRHLPVRLGFFRDGLYVVKTDARHRALLGGRVERLGTRRIADAIAAVTPVVHRDNDSGLREWLPVYLVVPEILHACGVVPTRDRVEFEVTTANGRRTAVVSPQPVGKPIEWLDARGAGPASLAEQRPESRHWFTRIPGTRVLYACHREVMDDPAETVAAFADSLFHELDRSDADRLILDIRGNVGGDGFLNRPIVHGAIASSDLRKPGALFVLADGGTFSAATMLQSDLERETPALFLGVESGGAPNGYGDSRRVRLPNTGLTLRISTLYWQLSDPRDHRDGIAPHVEVEPTFEDWRMRQDPVVDSALALTAAGLPREGVWRGEISVGYQRIPFSIRLTRRDSVDARPASPPHPMYDRKVTPVWDAWLDVPAFEVRDERVATGITGDAFSFTYRGNGPPWEFEARCAPNAILGFVRWRGSSLPFLLRPDASR